MTAIRVVLVDDDHLVRGGIRLILATAADIDVVGEAEDGIEALATVRLRRPDVVLMDVRMDRMDGIEATAALTRERPECRVLVLTTFEHDQYVFEALRAGASGFLLKRTSPEDLIAGVRLVASGEALLSPAVTRRVIEAFADTPSAPVHDERLRLLTDRETEVLRALATGASNAELAAALFISEETVRTHVKHILTKASLRDRAQAIVFAYESGLARPGPAPW